MIRVLLVEDNDDDIVLTTEALDAGKFRVELHVETTGDGALRYLRRAGEHTDAHRPDLIMLDLNLPGTSGVEVLTEIKSDDELGSIPVVIMTTSRSPADIEATYKLHANCYVTKPVDVDAFISIVHQIEDFWLTVVRLPHGRP
ncbi:MAG: response regulator [Actinomycetes bacterium]